MNQLIKEKLIKINESLINEAQNVIDTQWRSRALGSILRVKTTPVFRWMGKVKSFCHQLGLASKPWKEILLADDPKTNSLSFVYQVLGTLEAIKYELENDHLETFTQLVRAETLAELLDQAEYLLRKEYFLAAGVIGRAVLEEHLRATCTTLEIEIQKSKPTINDFNQALYKFDFFSKIKMKQVELLAAIGNNAAHNKDELTKDDVKKLISDLPGLIESTNI